MNLTLRLIVSALIFVLIFRNIDVAVVWKSALAADRGLLVMAALAQLASGVVAAYRWQLLMQNLRFGQSLRFYGRSYFKGMFFNQGLPTSIGGDALRILDVAGRGFRKRDALYGVLLDRATGLAALVFVHLVALFAQPDLLPRNLFILDAVVMSSALAAFVLAFQIQRLSWIMHSRRLVLIRVLSVRLRQAFRSRRTILLATSVLIHLLSMASVYTIGHALGMDYHLMVFLVIVPPAILFTVVPVSLAGWGIREGALVSLFSLLGADRATVLAMSVLYGLILIITSLPGLFVYLVERQSPGMGKKDAAEHEA